MKSFIIICIGLLLGAGAGIFVFYVLPQQKTIVAKSAQVAKTERGEVIGFLPYALLNRAQNDYAKYITTLAYFGLTIDTDGTILRLRTPQEAEPGYHALHSGTVDPFLAAAKEKKLRLSLVMYLGDNDNIDTLMSDPITNAHNLSKDVLPVMEEHGFQDLNIDIESTKEASPAAQQAFIDFLKTIKTDLHGKKSITVDVSTLDVIRQDLIKPRAIAAIADRIVLMTYDFHSTASTVTGAVAPVDGAGDEAEYDAASAVQEALKQIPRQKLILGMPTYGYEWETISHAVHAAIIPSTGVVLSNKRAEETVAQCTNCKTVYDKTAKEVHSVYFDTETGSYRQLYYPDKNSTAAKIAFVREQRLPGVAVWALGYEGATIMDPLADYRKSAL